MRDQTIYMSEHQLREYHALAHEQYLPEAFLHKA